MKTSIGYSADRGTVTLDRRRLPSVKDTAKVTSADAGQVDVDSFDCIRPDR